MSSLFPLEPEQQADQMFTQAMEWLRAGQLHAARNLLVRAAALHAEQARPVPEGYARLALGRVLLELGEQDAAHAELERAVALLAAAGEHTGQVRLLFELGELAEQRRLVDEARQKYAQILAIEGLDADAALAHLRLGALDRDRGATAAAAAHYAAARRLFVATGNELGEARAALEEARLLMETQPGRARDLLAQGRDLAELYGQDDLAAVAHLELARLAPTVEEAQAHLREARARAAAAGDAATEAAAAAALKDGGTG